MDDNPKSNKGTMMSAELNAETAYRAEQDRITSEVNDIMGGGDMSLIIKCMSESDEMQSEISNLTIIDCGPVFGDLSVSQLMALSKSAHAINNLIAVNLRGYVDKKS